MAAALVIELTGESVATKLLLVLLPALVLAGAAVVAARIARKSAIERQQEQLNHDSARQEKALRQDREMREQEREYDRKIRSHERSRDTLDAALANLLDARMLGNSYATTVAMAAKRRSQREKEREEATSPALERSILESQTEEVRGMTEEGRLAFAALSPLTSDRARLELRFGREHRITKLHVELRAALREREKLIDSVASEYRPFTDEQDKEESAHLQRIGGLSGQFLDACREWDTSEPG